MLIIIIVFGITGTASADIPIVGFEDEEQSQWADFAFPNDGLTEQQTNPENSSNGIPLISIYDSGNNEQEQLTSDTDNTPVFTETVPATELGIGEMNADGQYNRQYSNEAKTTVTAAQLLKMIQDGDETATTLAKQLGFGYRTEDQIANLTKLVEEYALFPDFIEPGFEIDDVNIKLDKEITEDTEDGLSGYRTTINVETTAAITIQYDERGETKIIRRVPSANPTDFVITLDVSGSMNYYGRDKAMFSALETLLKEIFEDPKNTASVIFWADNASVMRLDINQDGIIESTFSGENGITVSNMFESPLLDASGSPDSKNTSLETYKTNTGWYNGIIGRIESLYRTSSGTEPDKGLQQAIDLLNAMNRADNRNLGVLLFTDGDANYSSKTPTVELEKKLAEDYYAKVVNVSIGDESQVERYREYLDPTSNNYRGGDDAVLQNRVVYYNIPNLTDEELAARVTAMFDTAFEEFTSEKVELKTETVTTGIMAAVNAKLIETIPAGFEVHSTDGHTYTVDGVDEKGNTIISFQLDDLMAGQTQSVSYFTVPISEDQDIGLTAYTENANTVLYAEPVNRIAQEQDNRGIEIVYNTLAQLSKPPVEEPIKSATLEAVGQALVNHQFRITVVTDGSVTRLSAKNNNDYPLQENWTKSYNPDGTIIWVRVYNADVSDPNRYWTVTAWMGDTAVGSMQTNTLGIGDVSLTLTADKTTAMVGEKVTFIISSNAETGIVSLLADGKYPLGTIDLSKNGRTIAWSFSNSGKRIISAYLDGVKVGSITVSIKDDPVPQIQEALSEAQKLNDQIKQAAELAEKLRIEKEYKEWWMKNIYPAYEWYVNTYRPVMSSDKVNFLKKPYELAYVSEADGLVGNISDEENYQITLMNVAESVKSELAKKTEELKDSSTQKIIARENTELERIENKRQFELNVLKSLLGAVKSGLDVLAIKNAALPESIEFGKEYATEFIEALISAIEKTFKDNFNYHKELVKARLYAEEYVKALDNADEMYIDYLNTAYFNNAYSFNDSGADYDSVYKRAAETLIESFEFAKLNKNEKLLYAYRKVLRNDNLTMEQMNQMIDDSKTFEETEGFAQNCVIEVIARGLSLGFKKKIEESGPISDDYLADIEKMIWLSVSNNVHFTGNVPSIDFEGIVNDIQIGSEKFSIQAGKASILSLFFTSIMPGKDAPTLDIENIYSLVKDVEETVTSTLDVAGSIIENFDLKKGIEELRTYADFLKDQCEYRRDIQFVSETVAYNKETFEKLSAQELEARRQALCIVLNVDESIFKTYKKMEEICEKNKTDDEFKKWFNDIITQHCNLRFDKFNLQYYDNETKKWIEYTWLSEEDYKIYTDFISRYRDLMVDVPDKYLEIVNSVNE